jgi:ABC-type enterochelin transport system ATPase subunit
MNTHYGKDANKFSKIRVIILHAIIFVTVYAKFVCALRRKYSHL